ncbi:hypothetical protein SAMN05216519_1330 [Delftia acidovorans]|nr:hypothetical protein SAMN05216519_1330 [Delftia acidovorans]
MLAGSALVLAACGGGASGIESPIGDQPAPSQETTMKIRMTVDGQVATATLRDNATARDFAALLPLTLTLTDYARIERIADLPQRLTSGSAESTVPVKAGDLAYYAPWGNLAIFVEDGTGNYTGDLMRLGAVETGLPALQRPGPLQVRIERTPD